MSILRRITNRLMSRCRECGSSKDVISYDPRGPWAYFWRRTWCPDHCPDHDYVYSRYDGHYCNNCGQEPDPQWYADRADDMADLENAATRIASHAKRMGRSERMRFRGLKIFGRTSSDDTWTIASFHSPHSLTWRWVLSFSRLTGDGRRAWPIAWGFRHNSGMTCWFRIPWLAIIQFHTQRPIWYRDLYIRLRDEQDQRSGMLWLHDKHPHKIHEPETPRIVVAGSETIQ